MTAVTNQYSLELPALNCEGIAQKIEELDADTISRWIQLGAITTALGGACALSAAGILPAAVLVSCAAGATALLANIVLSNTVMYALDIEEKEGESEYSDAIKQISPFATCVAIPVIEEIVFRTFVQGGLYAVLSYVIPATAVITIVGLEFPVAAVVSIVAAGAIFGLAHASNHPDDPLSAIMHTATATVAGVFVLGPLYYAFGIWGSALAHIANNTIAIGMGEVADAFSAKKTCPQASMNEKPKFIDSISADKKYLPASV